jgi:hypothetical protein
VPGVRRTSSLTGSSRLVGSHLVSECCPRYVLLLRGNRPPPSNFSSLMCALDARVPLLSVLVSNDWLQALNQNPHSSVSLVDTDASFHVSITSLGRT